MASQKDSDVEKSVDLPLEGNVSEPANEEDPIKEGILAVNKMLLWEQRQALASDIKEYRNNLSRQLFKHLSELEAQPADMTRFGASFKAGWREWKKRGEQREESSFAAFLHAMKADSETL